MKIGFTGTQVGTITIQSQQLVFLLADLGMTVFHHGCCIGADDEAALIVAEQFPDVRIVGHPPVDRKKIGKEASYCHTLRESRPYLDRNRAIVAETEILVACPKGPEEQRSGTWMTVRYARKKGRRVVIVWPNGTITDEPSTGLF